MAYQSVLIGCILIVVVLLARYLSLLIPVKIFSKKLNFIPHTTKIMTWGGLRGGISIALALSIPEEMNRELFLTISYVIVVFSIVVQGLTIDKVVNYFSYNASSSKKKG
jgi:CPA1 family monovalent cation:H+ antiporter